MSFSITFFTPGHFWWREFHRGRKRDRFWFYRADRYSGGGVGFCIPGLHVTLLWGAR